MTRDTYTTQLQAGLGLIPETRVLLDLWEKDMLAPALNDAALNSGEFPNVTARRLRNIVLECFAPRYLRCDALPAQLLKAVLPNISTQVLQQVCLTYTARANSIVRAFIEDVFWPMYAAGRATIEKEHARTFVEDAVHEGHTTTAWSESTIHRVSGYLCGICHDFGLLGDSKQGERSINTVRLDQNAALLIAYDLKFQGLTDMAIVSHQDWALFGLEKRDVLETFKQLTLDRHLLLQRAGAASSITWSYTSIEEIKDATR